MTTCLLIALFLPFLLAPLTALLGGNVGRRAGWIALTGPVLCTGLLGWALGQVPDGQSLALRFPWVPGLGLELHLLLDGLSLFYALVVSGMGVLIFSYALAYFSDEDRDLNRFFSYLLLFMGAMLGTVLSGHLLLLFVFWELTGLASFLLIGFLHRDAISRAGARMALLTTGGTGLLLLAGVVLLAEATGSYVWSEVVARIPSADPALLTAALVCCALGAFGKSAQFPFHFWLPNAMAAPTPVSAYLHSATMVKLGVFLLARLMPVFHGLDLWAPLLTTVGFVTFAFGAFAALRSHALKAILAYTTVAQLGFLIGFYGLAPAGGAPWDLLHIINHVLYKGALFMVVGIITHSTGITDIRQLGGLRRHAPALALIAGIATASMAGLPGTLGFISKEYGLKEALSYGASGAALAWMPLALITLGSIFKIAACARFFLHTFAGAERSDYAAHVHAPGPALLAAPALLALASLALGLHPAGLTPLLAACNTPGIQAAFGESSVPHLWHGFNTALALSAVIVGLGLALYALCQRLAWRWDGLPSVLRFDRAFERGVEALPYAARRLTRALRADHPVDYLPMVAGGATVAVLLALAPLGGGLLDTLAPLTRNFDFLVAAVAALAGASALGAVVARRWTTQLLFLSVVGVLLTFIFFLFSAPDLALTQILIEAATLILAVLFLARFPRQVSENAAGRSTSTLRRGLNLAVAVGIGVATTALMLAVLAVQHPERIGPWFLEATLPLAMGTNAVNTIIVDFRGFDTLLEISVMVIAALGCLGLLYRVEVLPPSHVAARLRPDAPNAFAPDGPHASPIFRAVALVFFFIVNLLAIYLLLRGHNEPGGGFIAGVATAVSLILLSFSNGFSGVSRLLRLDPLVIAGLGLLLSLLTSTVPLFFGDPFLETYNWKGKDLPLIGELYLGTPILFDLGVYFVVVGVIAKVVFALRQSTTARADLLEQEVGPYHAAGEEPVEAEGGKNS